ncbi:MAG: hypothetical protein GY772_13720 [bacterium]|nr:hypothetical protein [bacterium]
MRVLVPVTLEIVCAGTRAAVSMDLEMEAQVLSYTPPEPAGLEHAPVHEEWEIEIRLCDDPKAEDIVVCEGGQLFDLDDQQRESVIEQLRGAR